MVVTGHSFPVPVVPGWMDGWIGLHRFGGHRRRKLLVMVTCLQAASRAEHSMGVEPKGKKTKQSPKARRENSFRLSSSLDGASSTQLSSAQAVIVRLSPPKIACLSVVCRRLPLLSSPLLSLPALLCRASPSPLLSSPLFISALLLLADPCLIGGSLASSDSDRSTGALLLLQLCCSSISCPQSTTDKKGKARLQLQQQEREREREREREISIDGEVRAGSGDRGGQLRGGQADEEQGDAGARRHEVHRERQQDRRERFPRDRQPPFSAAPQHHPLQGGCADADAPGYRDGVRGGRRAVRAHLRGRAVPRGRGALLLPAAGVRGQLLPRHADLPQGPQAGEHAAGRQPGAKAQDLRLWILKVLRSSLAAQVNGWHARLHRPGGALPPRVRRQARRRLVLRRHALRHARRSIPIRGSKGPQELQKDDLEDHVGAVQDPRVRARLTELPPPPLPHLRRKPIQEDHHERDQEPPMVPQEPAAGAQGGGPGRLLHPPGRRRRQRQQCPRSGCGILGAERAGHHEDRAGGADGAQAAQAGLGLRLGRRLGRRRRPIRGGGRARRRRARGGGRRLRQDGAAGARQRGLRHEQAPNLTHTDRPHTHPCAC